MKKSFITSGLIDELNDQTTGVIDTARSDEVQCTASCILAQHFIWFNNNCHYHNIQTAHARIQKVSLGGGGVSRGHRPNECCNIHVRQLYIVQ